MSECGGAGAGEGAEERRRRRRVVMRGRRKRRRRRQRCAMVLFFFGGGYRWSEVFRFVVVVLEWNGWRVLYRRWVRCVACHVQHAIDEVSVEGQSGIR